MSSGYNGPGRPAWRSGEFSWYARVLTGLAQEKVLRSARAIRLDAQHHPKLPRISHLRARAFYRFHYDKELLTLERHRVTNRVFFSFHFKRDTGRPSNQEIANT
jgi:hypothetical protein